MGVAYYRCCGVIPYPAVQADTDHALCGGVILGDYCWHWRKRGRCTSLPNLNMPNKLPVSAQVAHRLLNLYSERWPLACMHLEGHANP